MLSNDPERSFFPYLYKGTRKANNTQDGQEGYSHPNPTYLNKKQARQEKVKQKKNSILRFGNFNIYI